MTARQSKAGRRATILAHVRNGNARRHAAALAGVPFSTFYAWCEEPKFADDLTAAEAEFARVAVERIDAAARRGSWRAQLALLERRLPNDWQERSRLEIDGNFEGDVTAEERTMLRKIREQAAQPYAEQVAEVRDLLLIMLDTAAEDGGIQFVRTVHERTERLLARDAMLARAGTS